jgi:hypothetical protein
VCAVVVIPAAAYFSGFGAGAVQVRAARTGTDAVAVSIRFILWCALGEINGLVGGAPAFQDVGSGQDSLPVESGAGRLQGRTIAAIFVVPGRTVPAPRSTPPAAA